MRKNIDELMYASILSFFVSYPNYSTIIMTDHRHFIIRHLYFINTINSSTSAHAKPYNSSTPLLLYSSSSTHPRWRANRRRAQQMRLPVRHRRTRERSAATVLRVVQRVAAATERRYEAVRVRGRLMRPAAVLVLRQLALRELGEVLLQVDGVQRFAERQLLRMADVQVLAQIDHRIERFDREVDATVEVTQIGQLDAQRLVHGREVEQGVGVHAALVERGAGARQPFVLLRPPQGVVGPVLGILWRTESGWWRKAIRFS